MPNPDISTLQRQVEDTVAGIADERDRAVAVYDLVRAIYDGVKRVTFEPGAGFDGKDTAERNNLADMVKLAYDHMRPGGGPVRPV